MCVAYPLLLDFFPQLKCVVLLKLFYDPDRYTLMRVIEELPLLKMSTNISGHSRIYRDMKYCICNLHHLTIFCNQEVYLAIPSNIN